MPTDLTQDVKELFKSAPPPRRVLFSQWHEYIEEPEPEPEPVEEQPIIPIQVPKPTEFIEVVNQHARRRYDNESRNIRRMAVLRCMQDGMTDRHKIGAKLGLPAGTVFHDLQYWRKQLP